MAVDVAGEGFLPVVAHLHGAAGVERKERPVDLHREVLAAAEGAADAREMDAHLLRVDVEARRHLIAIDVEPLGGDVDVDAALPVRHGEAGLGPEERLVLDPDLVRAVDDDLALRVGLAVADHEMPNDVRPGVFEVAVAHRRPVGMERLLLERALHVDDGLERGVLDLDRGECLPRLLGVVGGDERHRLADVAHPVDREHRLVGELQAVRFPAGHVGVGEDRVHPRHGERPREVDGDDPRVRVRTAQRVAPEHPRRRQVARVVERALDLRDRVVAQEPLADPPDPWSRPWRGDAHRRSAASCTASKIFA
jgi:hypothetical protein